MKADTTFFRSWLQTALIVVAVYEVGDNHLFSQIFWLCIAVISLIGDYLQDRRGSARAKEVAK